ncbi:D-alanyl-D-alanine carboxypeptidase family protein [Streptomyces sp. CB01580]|uniref:D-alanyl-D-alanine carboxypeptidase family protein n=1 Tax=Streptomyces sp. CB01580 TaxID=1703933 RepID=UPI003FD5E397
MVSAQETGAQEIRGAGPDGARRNRPRVGGVCVAAAVLIAVGAGGCFAGSRADEGGPVSASSSAMGLLGLSLPWPGEGQTSILVEGLGSLGSKGGRRPVPIASLTKVMTAYVVLKEHPLGDGEPGPLITVDERAAQEAFSLSESTVPLREGQSLTQRQLLELLLLPSGNNVARLLARWDAGSQEAFVAKMNDAARDLGMTRTTYTGASGIEPTTVSTAEDQLVLARQAMGIPVLRTVVALRRTTVPGVSGTVVNTNRLLDRPGVIGLKTGSSSPAGGALMWAAEAGSGTKRRLVLGVVLGQRVDTTPEAGLRAALDRSGALIEAVRDALPAVLDSRGQVRA